MRLIYVNSSKVTKLEQKMNNSEKFLLLLKNLPGNPEDRFSHKETQTDLSEQCRPSLQIAPEGKQKDSGQTVLKSGSSFFQCHSMITISLDTISAIKNQPIQISGQLQ